MPEIAGTLIEAFQNPFFFFFFFFFFLKSDGSASGWIYSMAGEGRTYFGADAVPRMFVYLHTSKKIQKYWSSLLALLYSKDAMKFSSVRKYSFFERAHFTIQDIMLFIKQCLGGVTLLEASRQAGISYQKSGVDWASFIRELFKEDLHRSLPHIRLSGEVEKDESQFGRRAKYHRGRP